MKKFWTSKKFWIFILVLLIAGLFIFFSRNGVLVGEILPDFVSPEELKTDKFEPASQIRYPESDLWQKEDFAVSILDEDLESGLDTAGCQFKIISYEKDGTEHSTGWWKRKCNYVGNILVGLEEWCGFEGERACWLFVRSQDKAGNLHSPAEDKGSIKYYNIDWTKPEVKKPIIENKEVKVSVSDNFKITGCNLYLDKENLGPMSFLMPGCQKECVVFKSLDFDFEPGEHQLFAVCQDTAQNHGRGESLLIRENLPPEISSCKVLPTQGNLETEFNFQVEVKDPDEDNLTFLWDFGDGKTSSEQNPVYKYLKTGTFEPKVKVFDGKGSQDICSTAWVVVNE